MTAKTQPHQRKHSEQIEVLGLLDVRKIIKESESGKLANGHTKPNRYVKELSRPTKKFYINRKDSPVRNICEEYTTREEAIKMFDKLLWDSWHACEAMEEPVREWFIARKTEYLNGDNIDLICDCRKFNGNNDSAGLPISSHPHDCHGYTLKNYIEFLANR